jgi:hypothetical protein
MFSAKEQGSLKIIRMGFELGLPLMDQPMVAHRKKKKPWMLVCHIQSHEITCYRERVLFEQSS